jgi:hypothetical protein
MQSNNFQTIPIPFDTYFHNKFHIWHRVQLFIHVSFNEAEDIHVCENNELHHKFVKPHMNDCGFAI